MSYSLDANILLYAADRASPRFERSMNFLQQAVAGPEIVAITWPTIMAFLRIATHPRIFSSPLSSEDAQANIISLVRSPYVRLLSEETGFWDVYSQVTRGMSVRGNLVPDAHIAALLRQHDVTTLYTNDSDFRKFTFLRLRNPFE